jgi:hypothetical protein
MGHVMPEESFLFLLYYLLFSPFFFLVLPKSLNFLFFFFLELLEFQLPELLNLKD